MSKNIRLVVPFVLVLACGTVPPEALSARTCSSDAECPPPSVDCAEARCNPDTKSCEAIARDLDGDGERASQCAGTGIVLGTDCDESNARTNSAAQEVCDTAGVDENCNGSVNEGCACRGGADQASIRSSRW